MCSAITKMPSQIKKKNTSLISCLKNLKDVLSAPFYKANYIHPADLIISLVA